MRRQSTRRRARRGATTVEFALTAPILFLFVFAGLEFGRLNMICHTMENAVYEGARRGLVPQATDNDIRKVVQSVMGAVSARQPTVTISRANANLTVSVETEWAKQGWVVPMITGNRTLRKSVTLAQDVNE